MPGLAATAGIATQVANGILSNGIVGTTGAVRYVCSVNGSDTSGQGTTANPYATLGYAAGLCTASKGDVVFLMPGHAETVHTAAYATLSVAGIKVVGLGNGRNRPVLTWDATAATLLVTGANISFQNIVFDFTGIDAVVAGIKVDAADVSFYDCSFVTNAAAAGVVSGITAGATTTSPRFHVERCTFRGPATNSGTTTTAQITITDAPDFRILDSYFTGKMTQAITNAAANLRGEINNCRFVVYTGTKGVNMHASSTPFISNCRFNVPSGTAPIVAAAGFVAGNTYSAAAGVTAGTASTF